MKSGKDYIGVGCGALIFNDKDETLLLKRGKNCKNEAGTWARPGGEIEFGETAEEAIRREIKEELGVDVEIERFTDYWDHIIKAENQHWIVISFIAKIVSGEPKNMEPHKHDEIRWFSLNDLPEKLYSPTARSLKDYLEQRTKA